jgi:hypothetical protein
MPKVLISDKMDPRAAQIFRERGVEVDEITGKTPAELIAMIGEYDGLAIRSSTKVTKEILEHATNLKVVGRAGIGVDNVDIPAASAKGVVVMNTPFGNSITTAEHAIALMFALARQLPEADASTQAGKWEKNRFMGVELTSKTLGLIGAGNIGSIVADRARGLAQGVAAVYAECVEQIGEAVRRVGEKEAQPDALAADTVKAVVPVTRADLQQTVVSPAAPPDALQRAHGVLEDAAGLPRGRERGIALALVFRELRRGEPRRPLRAEGSVARFLHIFNQRPRQPEQIVRNARAHAALAPRVRVPPVADVALGKLMRTATQDLLACWRGSK